MSKSIYGLLVCLILCQAVLVCSSTAQANEKAQKKGTAKKASVKSKPKMTSAEEVKEGKVLFKAYDCAACHTIEGKGCTDGIALDHEGAKRSEQFIFDQLKDPEAHVSKNPKAFGGDPVNLMPKTDFEPNELRLICKYLHSLK